MHFLSTPKFLALPLFPQAILFTFCLTVLSCSSYRKVAPAGPYKELNAKMARVRMLQNSYEEIILEKQPGKSLPLLPQIDNSGARNIILFIGDGVGPAQLQASRYKYYGHKGRLNLERMPVTGLVSTHPNDTTLITDSAAGATAIATGHKTKVGMVGMAADSNSRETILEYFQSKGASVGLISFGSINNATPASFGTHVVSRENKSEITRQLLSNKINYLWGDSDDFFIDGINEQTVKDYGYVLFRNQNLVEPDFKNNKQIFLYDSLISESLSIGRNQFSLAAGVPSLAEVTAHAIKSLSENPAGFFLMVEEDWTDSWGHEARGNLVLEHVKNLDDAIAVALNFASDNEETLVIFTADHETGGLTVTESSVTQNKIWLHFSTFEHTAASVLYYAFGPGSSMLKGNIDNTDLFHVMKAAHQNYTGSLGSKK